MRIKSENQTIEIKRLKLHSDAVRQYVAEQQQQQTQQAVEQLLPEDLLQTSDLLSGVYEGGFKLWECSIDLIKWLEKQQMAVRGKRILECGCGHGVPGLYCLQQGASVDFQDYNFEVIDLLTVPNVMLNFKDECGAMFAEGRARFFSGDWSLLENFIKEKTNSEGYDLILTSDTLYALEAHAPLLSFLKAMLKKDGGVAIIGAKSYYFGVGGGTQSFRQLVEKDHPDLELRAEEVLMDGQSNVREILSLRYRR